MFFFVCVSARAVTPTAPCLRFQLVFLCVCVFGCLFCCQCRSCYGFVFFLVVVRAVLLTVSFSFLLVLGIALPLCRDVVHGIL